jgi:hypothetical protein
VQFLEMKLLAMNCYKYDIAIFLRRTVQNEGQLPPSQITCMNVPYYLTLRNNKKRNADQQKHVSGLVDQNRLEVCHPAMSKLWLLMENWKHDMAIRRM